jgi:hypothetical protein
MKRPSLHLALPVDRRRRGRLPRALGVLAAVALGLFGLFWALDYLFLGHSPQGRPAGAGPIALLFALDIDTLQETLSGLSQVVAAVLGIAITVASIVVQLAANRYTSRVADMFFRDRTNLAMMGFFVVACLQAVWVSVGISNQLVPRATIVMALTMTSASFLLLIPYFAYVFDFLDPEKVILRLGQQALDAGLGRRAFARVDIPGRQAAATASMKHLGDVAVNAVAQKDTVIASGAVGALRELTVHYLTDKARLPLDWFRLADRTRQDPDFIALAGESLSDLEKQKIWLEWKSLRHFRSVFAEALEHLPELAHVVAIETRYVGEAGLQTGDRRVVATVLKFFNTYLRTALNARHVRAAYNVLHQYRQLAESVVKQGLDDLALEIGRYLKYYGQTAYTMDLPFITETAAYDLSALCERAFQRRSGCHESLLRTFLEIDKEAETKAEEKALRGVRKAQVKLATYYLLVGAEPHARTVFQDLRHESPERLASIHGELAAITAKDFWEVTDRGVNFDYMDAAQKEKLEIFFGWLKEARAGRELQA